MSDKEARYDTVPLSEDREEWQSNTEVEGSLSGDEKSWLETGRRSKGRAFIGTLKSYRWAINIGLLLGNMGLLVVLLLRGQSGTPSSPSSSSLRQVGGDYTGKGPQFDTKIVKWEADFDFAPWNATEFVSNKTLDQWKTLMPIGTRWGKPGQTFFTTTMTHELHCVYMMGTMFSAVVSGAPVELDLEYYSHYYHCVDYLRQSIMCHGDVATEAHEPNEVGPDNGPLDGGWSGHHICKDYSQVIKYLEGEIKDGARTVLPIDD